MTKISPSRGKYSKREENSRQVDRFNEKEQQLYNFGTSISIVGTKRPKRPNNCWGEEKSKVCVGGEISQSGEHLIDVSGHEQLSLQASLCSQVKVSCETSARPVPS